MKKYYKIKNQTPVKNEKNNQEYNDPISQIYKESDLDKDFFYVIDTKKNDIVNSRNIEKKEVLNKTLKVENKSIGLFKNEFNEEQVDILSSDKKPKKKKIRKKKKSVKKDINIENEEEKKEVKYTVNGIEDQIPTPNGKDSTDYFYLIDYKSKTEKENNGINEPNPIMTEDNYNTFHDNKLEETLTEVDVLEEPNKKLYTEKGRKINISFTSGNSNKLSKSHYQIYNSTPNENSKTGKLSFDLFENTKKSEKNTEIKHDKMRKIKFRKNEDSQNKQVMELSADKIKERKKESDVNEERDNIRKESNNEKEYKIEKQKQKKSQSMHKKRKKNLAKKKLLIQNNKIILIQSIWRKYKMRKLISIHKNLQNFSFTFELLLNKRLKSNLLFFFERINSNYSNNRDNRDSNNIDNDNNNSAKVKSKKKTKKKLKRKNILLQNIKSFPEKDFPFSNSKDDNKINNDNNESNIKKKKFI